MSYELGGEVSIIGRIVGIETDTAGMGTEAQFDNKLNYVPDRITVLVEKVVTPPERPRAGTLTFQPWRRQQRIEVDL